MLVRCHLKKSKKDVPKKFEGFAKGRLVKLEKLPFKITKADVVTYKEGGFHNVELVLKGVKIIRANSATGSFEESLDKCIDKCLRQIKKLGSTHRAEPRRERRKNRRSKQLDPAAIVAARKDRAA